MRVLLVHPKFPITYWGFQYGLRVVGKKASLPPLGLITVAALLPPDWQLRLVDMNIEDLADQDLAWAEVVLVGGMLIQAPSMLEVIRRAKATGRRTIVGGPAPSTAPRDFEEADVVFGGEAEGREAELLALIEGRTNGRAGGAACERPVVIPLRKDARPDVATSPPPRFELLRLDAYASMAIQYSRGCPFSCEFCDIIEIFGRVPRMKTAAQVKGELDALLSLGWRGSIFIVDDNFIGNIKQVRKLLPELKSWQDQHGRPFDLYTEASVNLATDEKLVAAMVAAGFSSVFLGIETPSEEALRGTKKTQNLRLDLTVAIERLTRAGLEVMGGFIVGFDEDDESAFEVQRAFLADAPIPRAMIGLLTALPGTALWRRLESEDRLRQQSTGENFGRPNFTTAMPEEALIEGYARLLAELYSPAGFIRRCEAYLAASPGPHPGRLRHDWPVLLARILWRLGVLSPRRSMFWSLVWRTARRSLRQVPWAVEKAVEGEHLVRYTQEDVLPRLDQALADVRAAGGTPRTWADSAGAADGECVQEGRALNHRARSSITA